MKSLSKSAFIGLSEQELLTMRSKLVAEMTETPGQRISSVNTRDLSVAYDNGSDFVASDYLEAITYALQKLNPELYGTSMLQRKVKWVV